MIEDPIKGLLLPGIRETEIITLQNGIQKIIKGYQKRLTGSSERNEKSSSSHAVVTFICEHLNKQGSKVIKKSKITMIDLAGSERTTIKKMPGEIMK